MSCGCGCSGEVVAYEEWEDEDVIAAEYQGRSVTLNKPFRTKGASKKFGVYTKNGSGNVVIVRFGDPNMEIKRDDPARRKAFRSRHNCQTPGPKWKARYWSCRQWRSGKKVEAGMEDYIFSTPEGARQKSMEIGFDGEIHSDQMADGTPMYFPGPNEEEFQMWFDKNDSHDASASECNCGNVEAAEPTPNDTESHDEYMTRCQEAGYTKEECMKAHEGHEFEVEGYYDDDKKKAAECGYGEKMIDGECRKVAVTLELKLEEIEAKLIAETGKTVYEIRGIAFHEGMNKNNWSLTEEGARSVAQQMKDSDLTLYHPAANENGAGFTRNEEGLEESNVGRIVGASFFKTEGGYEVRYVAHVTQIELFPSLASGLWKEDGYGVSIGGSGIPVSADENGLVFGEDFTFDHLALVVRPAYDRANVESIKKIEIEEEMIASEPTFIGHSIADVNQPTVKSMSDEENTEINYEAQIEAMQAELVMANSRVAEFEAQVAAKAEEERMTLVSKASELGMSGHDELSSPTLETLIASWEEAHPAPTPVEMTPIASETKVVETIEASETPQVANYLNGKMVSNDEAVYAKAFNLWANTWNRTLAGAERTRMSAPSYKDIKEMR